MAPSMVFISETLIVTLTDAYVFIKANQENTFFVDAIDV